MCQDYQGCRRGVEFDWARNSTMFLEKTPNGMKWLLPEPLPNPALQVNMPILMTHGLMKYLSMLVYADVAT